LLRVALNAGDKGVRERVGLGALVNGLDDDDLKRQSVSGMFGGACADCVRFDGRSVFCVFMFDVP